MGDINWIRDLVLAEQNMEEKGIVDFNAESGGQQNDLEQETIEYLKDLKHGFIETASAFNQLKGTPVGKLKIYGISQTIADFMLFRNGYKLIFSMKRPGCISISFHQMGQQFVPKNNDAENESSSHPDETLITAQWGLFGELKWMYKNYEVKFDRLLRYYMTRFIKESLR